MSASDSGVDAVRSAFNTMINHLTPAQVMAFAQQLQSSTPAPSALSPAASSEADSISSPVQMTSDVNMPAGRIFHRTRLNPHAKKRPTNSYMCFRGIVASLIYS